MERTDVLVWIDCEMTGLDPLQDHLLEIAVIVTKNDLTVIAEGPTITIHQSDEVLETMNEWCKEHHGKSGLTERVRISRISEQEAQAQIIAFLEQYTQRGASPLCGNSVYVDRGFLRIHMPDLETFFHYRIVDVSSIKEIVCRWYNRDSKEMFEKKKTHRALNDIEESIAELRYYKEHFFKENN